MAHDANYNLCQSFDIDDGSLVGFGLEFIFCLGVEWQLFRQQLEAESGPFEYQVHTANVDRLVKLCERYDRKAKACWLHEDHPDWRVLHVEVP